jgi:putative cardiolipin synthase
MQVRTRLKSPVTVLTLICLLAAAGGCATVDFDTPKTESYAVTDTDDTFLAARAAYFTGDRAGESGFAIIPDAVSALAMRMFGARRAERTIDVQYYLIKADKAGLLLINELLEAADRGVRVRILVDDILTKGYDRGMVAMDAHPNIQIRVFNPFARRSARAVNFLSDFRRLNRRMHNKSFTADNQYTVIGGRNIGDEYFAGHEQSNFGDLDIVCVGPVVREVSSMFDLYWNYRLAVPVDAVIEPPEDPFQELAALRARIADALVDANTRRYEAVIEDIKNHQHLRREDLEWVPYQLVYDSPDKADKHLAKEADTMVPPLRQAILAGQEELIIVSPYFVPRSTMEGFRELRERGIGVRVVTNSLAANNHLAVHAGYAPARKPLLRMGAELYEIRPDASVKGVEETGFAESGGTLHAKFFIVDREKLFIGTFNWDPRSKNLNTEMGIILDSPRFAGALAALIDAGIPERAYTVTLDDRGRLRWTTQVDGQEVTYTKDPETTWWQRFKVGLYRMLPIRGQL